MRKPPLAATAWHEWGRFPVSSSSPDDTADAVVERLLTWPTGTLEALRHGFRLGLARQVGWLEPLEAFTPLEGSGTDAAKGASPLQVAAQIYKRGVAYGHAPQAGEGQIGEGEYAIEMLGDQADPIDRDPSVWTIVDGEVARLWPHALQNLDTLILNLDEHSKSLASVAHIVAAWRARGTPQVWQIIGGGLLADVAAFAAALVGSHFDLVPTTLLAMVDACVGGKTGVNFSPFGKNQVGAWYFPRAVRVWPRWLATLSERQLRAGAVEALKHSILSGDLDHARALAAAVGSTASWAPLLLPAMAFKAEVISRDAAEQGERAILNLGHTLGHALEAYALEKRRDETGLLHGEAVAFGLVYALMLSVEVTGGTGLPRAVSDQLIALTSSVAGCLNRRFLEEWLGEADLHAPHVFARLIDLMGMDKKNIRSKAARWVLLTGPGSVYRQGPTWTTEVQVQTLSAVWTQFVTRLP